VSGIGRPLFAAAILLAGIKMLGSSIRRDIKKAFGGDADMPYAYEFGGYVAMVTKISGHYTWLVFSPRVWDNRRLGEQVNDYPDFSDAEAMGKTDDAHAALDSANNWILEAQ
jgi:hypothetical protein